MFISDVFADRRIPEALQKDEVLWGECLAGKWLSLPLIYPLPFPPPLPSLLRSLPSFVDSMPLSLIKSNYLSFIRCFVLGGLPSRPPHGWLRRRSNCGGERGTVF